MLNKNEMGFLSARAPPLTEHQLLKIRDAFGPIKRKRQGSKVQEFISQIARYRMLFGDPTSEPPKTIKAQLEAASHAASMFANALSALGQECVR
jgi:hypothetical protein